MKNYRKLMKSSSKIENFIFFYKNCDFGGSFGNLSAFYIKIGQNNSILRSISPNISARWRKWKVF